MRSDWWTGLECEIGLDCGEYVGYFNGGLIMQKSLNRWCKKWERPNGADIEELFKGESPEACR